MIRSLAARVTLLQQVTIGVAMLGFALVAFWGTDAVLRREQAKHLEVVAQRLAASFDDELTEDPDPQAAAIGVEEDAIEAAVQVELRDTSGRVMATTDTVQADRAHAGRVTRTGVARAHSRSGVVITVWTSDEAPARTLRALVKGLLAAVLPTMLLGFLISRAVMTGALRPLSDMTTRASELSVEHNPRTLGGRCGLQEVDRLSEAFDRLLVRLDDAMSAERRLTADASHELRTPLTALSGELELLIEQSAGESIRAAGLRMAADHVRAMRELVEAILLLHRSGEAVTRDAAVLDAVNLGDVAREALAGVQALFPDRRQDVELLAPDELLVSGNTQLLASATRNLIDNAFKFTRAGQRIRITVASAGADATLAVEDGGGGVPENEQERIFDPFVRGALSGQPARASTPGFGLGLPILRRVARAHGGDVEVSSSALGGVSFTLTLPLRAQPKNR